MTIAEILLPVFVEVLLVFVLLGALSVTRGRVFKSRTVTPEMIAAGKPTWPDKARWVGESYSNQFEIPVLFFALVPLAIITRKADFLFVVLEWLFVLSRLAQAAIHTSKNVVPLRGAAFGAGALVLLVMWAIFAFRILLAPLGPA